MSTKKKAGATPPVKDKTKKYKVAAGAGFVKKCAEGYELTLEADADTFTKDEAEKVARVCGAGDSGYFIHEAA